ncbi:MAG: hypothetical protein AAF911_08825 [Planctomycetota bacterium]
MAYIAWAGFLIVDQKTDSFVPAWLFYSFIAVGASLTIWEAKKVIKQQRRIHKRKDRMIHARS